MVEISLGKKLKTVSEKVARAKRPGVMAQVVEQLPTKHKAVSSNPSITKMRERERQRGREA
jgi:hypothetical protein